MSGTVQYAQTGVSPVLVDLAVDPAPTLDAAERRARAHLGDRDDLIVTWHAEVHARDEHDQAQRTDWTPGTPVPPGTRLLVCTARTPHRGKVDR